jgi:hypothetical protein
MTHRVAPGNRFFVLRAVSVRGGNAMRMDGTLLVTLRERLVTSR